jgi:hypothetical protein
MVARRFVGSLNCLLGAVFTWVTLAGLLPEDAVAAPTSPFVFATSGVYDAEGNYVVPELRQSSLTGPLTVTAGSLPDAYGQFRSAFGSNGFDIQVTGGIDRAVYGGSIWTDGVTVLGGSGANVATFDTRIQGSITGQAEMNYALFVSSQPFDAAVMLANISASDAFSFIAFPNATRVMLTGVATNCGSLHPLGDCGRVSYENYQGALDTTLSANVPFVYGQTFYVASVFEGGVEALGGSNSFLNSADFRVTVPVGNTVQALSGTSYVAAIPEPPIAMLFATGGLFIAMRRWFSASTKRRQVRYSAYRQG